jgi:hypothetical protein
VSVAKRRVETFAPRAGQFVIATRRALLRRSWSVLAFDRITRGETLDASAPTSLVRTLQYSGSPS